MIGYIWKFLFHTHKWEIIDDRRLSDGIGQTGSRYILRCTECGTVKKKDLI